MSTLGPDVTAEAAAEIEAALPPRYVVRYAPRQRGTMSGRDHWVVWYSTPDGREWSRPVDSPDAILPAVHAHQQAGQPAGRHLSAKEHQEQQESAIRAAHKAGRTVGQIAASQGVDVEHVEMILETVPALRHHVARVRFVEDERPRGVRFTEDE